MTVREELSLTVLTSVASKGNNGNQRAVLT